MGVVMKGGTSGCRHDYLPPQNPGYDSQVPQDTASNNGMTDMVQFSQTTGNREGAVNPPVPQGGAPDGHAT